MKVLENRFSLVVFCISYIQAKKVELQEFATSQSENRCDCTLAPIMLEILVLTVRESSRFVAQYVIV